MAAPAETVSVVSSPVQGAWRVVRPLPEGGVVAVAELAAKNAATITPEAAIRLLLSMLLLSKDPDRSRHLGSCSACPTSTSTNGVCQPLWSNSRPRRG